MRSLFLSQELAPYFTEGGLGLSTSGLPTALNEAFGIQFTIMLPYYPSLVSRAGLQTERIADLPPVAVGLRREAATIYRAVDIGGEHEVLLVRSDAWYDRDGGIYRDRDYISYRDAIPRAAFFGWCVFRWLQAHPTRFSMIHANDWQSGLALFLSCQARAAAGKQNPALLYEIHTAESQGQIQRDSPSTLGLDADSLLQVEAISQGQPSMMLLGLLAADAVVTCSPTYARELVTTLASTPMIGPLRRLGISGIVSGIDPHEWDPSDPQAPSGSYTAENVTEGKRRSKVVLQSHCGLRVDPSQPLLGICGRLVQAKGIELVLNGLNGLLRSGVLQLVVMGAGESQYVSALRLLEAAHPLSVRYCGSFDPRVARLLYAGCDFTLMPSLVEPCGLNQLISMRYGTFPIVSPVGGLSDTVVNVLRDPTNGTGFVLAQISADGLRSSVEQAIAWLRGNPQIVREARQRVMQLDWSWHRAAIEYGRLYDMLLHSRIALAERTASDGRRLR